MVWLWDGWELVHKICILGGISVSICLLFGSIVHTYGLAAQFRQAQEELGEPQSKRRERREGSERELTNRKEESGCMYARECGGSLPESDNPSLTPSAYITCPSTHSLVHTHAHTLSHDGLKPEQSNVTSLQSVLTNDLIAATNYW